MIEERKQELALKVLNQPILQSIPLIYKTESIISFNEPSYKVMVCSVDLTEIVSSISRYSYPKLGTLIKYSEAKFSPVSSARADCIQLATPSYYRNFETGENSEFIADDLEGACEESLDWRNKGSTVMEDLKKRFASYSINSRNLNAKITWARDNFWMYCTSIAPDISYKRSQQKKHLSSDYDFMTKIEEPSKFAEQLGQAVGKQIELRGDLRVDYFDWQIGSLIASKLGVQSSAADEYFISVYHGPVFYLNADKIERLIQRCELGVGLH